MSCHELKESDIKDRSQHCCKRVETLCVQGTKFLPGIPQNTIQNLSVATGNMLSGILFSRVWPTAADVPEVGNKNDYR